MIFPGLQGGPLEHVIAGKAVAFWEAMQPSFKDYCARIIENAKAMAQSFVERGYRVVSGGTDNHLFVLDLRNKGIKGNKASNTLDKVNITVSKSTVPYDPEKPWVTSGIRIGTPALTTREFTVAEMSLVAEFIDEALSQGPSPELKERVRELALKHPMP